MKKITLEIKPKIGFGELDFSATDQQVLSKLGDPDSTEIMEEEVEAFNVLLWDYNDMGLSLFFEGDETARLSACEIDNPDVTLYGKKIFEATEKEIIDLMKANNFSQMNIENEMWEEKRVSFDDALIDFYFKNDRLVSVNWGVVINEKGEVEWYNK
ncbi:MAG: hypothetical protein R6U19_02140 [Bacteroidales bacterium]